MGSRGEVKRSGARGAQAKLIRRPNRGLLRAEWFASKLNAAKIQSLSEYG
jgi:hypothetical protein